MANLLTIQDMLELGFVIPNSNDVSVIERVNMIITQNERPILEAIFGVSLTQIIYSELDVSVPRAELLWEGDVVNNYRYEGLKRLVSNMIYFLIIEDRIIYLSASGVMTSMSENSEKVNPNQLMNMYFNEYVRIRLLTYDYMNDSDDWVEWDSQFFQTISIRSDYNF